MDSRVDISIIIPVYNVEKYLRDCLDSVVEQAYHNFEVLCIDDGSTDTSLDILEEYEKKYEFVKIYSKDNGGLSSARNYGMKQAKGRFIFFLDSDDMLADRGCLSFIADNMIKFSLDALYFDGESFFENESLSARNNSYRTAYKREKSYGYYSEGMHLFKKLAESGDYYVQVSLQCFSTEFLIKNDLGFVDKAIYEDNLFTFKSMLLAGNVLHQKRTVLLRRIREGSIIQKPPVFHNFYSLTDTYWKMLDFVRSIDKDKKQEISKSLFCVLNHVRSYAADIWLKLGDMEKGQLERLPEYESCLIKSIFCPEIKVINDAHIFPYHLFDVGARIVIYGAGNIGRKFYHKGIKDGVIHVAGIVDGRASDLDLGDIPVLPVQMIKRLEYDYILIAVESRTAAGEIRQNLVEMGIEPDRIKWNGDIYYKKNYFQKAYQFCKFVDRQMCSDIPKFYLFMLPEHGNMGDYAIGYAEQKFFTDYFPEYPLICVTAQEWLDLKEYFQRVIREYDIIFLSGGGYFGDLWKSGQISRDIVEMFPGNSKIFLPNNLTYKDSDWESNSEVKNDLEWLSEQPGTFIFFRERKSFEYAEPIVKNCAFVPDMALYLSFAEGKPEPADRILLCFREDVEKDFYHYKELTEMLKKEGYQYDEMDIHLNRKVDYEEGRDCLSAIIEKMQNASLVITDRLHGMVLAAQSGTPCIAFDNTTHKISGVYEWLESNLKVSLFTDYEESEIQEKITELQGTFFTTEQKNEKTRIGFQKLREKILEHIQQKRNISEFL